MKSDELDKLEALAKAATPGPRVMSPRHIKHLDQIEGGADWEHVASSADPEEWLGWECNSGFYSPGRGDFSGPDAAFLGNTDPQKILSMIARIRELEALASQRDTEYHTANDDRADYAVRIRALESALAGRQELIGAQALRIAQLDAELTRLAGSMVQGAQTMIGKIEVIYDGATLTKNCFDVSALQDGEYDVYAAKAAKESK